MLDPYFKQQFPRKHLKKSLYWHLRLSKVFRDATAVLFTTEEERILARQSFARYRVNEVVVPYGTFGPTLDTAAAAEEFLASFPQLRVADALALSPSARIHPAAKGTGTSSSAAFAAPRLPQKIPQTHRGISSSPALTRSAGRRTSKPSHSRSASPIASPSRANSKARSSGAPSPHPKRFRPCLAPGKTSASSASPRPSARGLPVVLSDKINIWREWLCEKLRRRLRRPEDTVDGTTTASPPPPLRCLHFPASAPPCASAPARFPAGGGLTSRPPQKKSSKASKPSPDPPRATSYNEGRRHRFSMLSF